MTRRKANYGRLLNKFADRKSKPTSTGKRGSIRLPSAAELLAIDARAEQAANRVRIAQVKFKWVETTSDTSDGRGPQTGQDGATPPAPCRFFPAIEARS